MFGHIETKVIYGVPTIVKFISSNKKTTLYARSDTNVILLKDKVYLCNVISHEELIDRYIYHKKLHLNYYIVKYLFLRLIILVKIFLIHLSFLNLKFS